MIRTEECTAYYDPRSYAINVLTDLISFSLLLCLFFVSTREMFWIVGLSALATIVIGRIVLEWSRPQCTCNGQDPH